MQLIKIDKSKKRLIFTSISFLLIIVLIKISSWWCINSNNLILKNNLDVVLYNHKLIDLYCFKKNKVNVHIKFNTGMNRYGFDRKDISIIVKKIKANSHLKLNSICSHLAASEDETKKNITLTQIKKFQQIGEDFELHGLFSNNF